MIDNNGDPSGEAPAAEKGGCLKMGWGCLPAVAALTILPPLFF